MKIRSLINVLALIFCSLTFVEQTVFATNSLSTPVQTSPCANGQESGLPLPGGFLPAKLSEFQAQLKTFLTSGKYRTLNWCEDKKLRDTGPFVNTVSYGVHPTVKIYYSPTVINWLLKRDSGQAIPDGAMIVKEQYTAPAARYQLQPPTKINGWTRNVTITASLNYQSIPPYFLNDRFSQAPDGPATQRLYYLTSNLQTKGTPIENWKFHITSASQTATVR